MDRPKPYTLPEPTQEDLDRKARVDAERIEAAMAKRRRKLEKFTNTPQAKARRIEQEREEQGTPWTPPADLYPDPE